jgi:putative ABC transport system permease protein
LQLARGLQRQQEYAVRCALGAQRIQLFRQALTESLLLALLGGGLGIGLAVGIVKAIKIFGAHAIPRLDSVKFGWPILMFCCVSAVAAAVMAGFAPAFHAACLDAAGGLRGKRTSSMGRTERRFLGSIAIAQTALTLALLVSAGLLIQTVNNLARLRPGYETQNILTMSVTIPDMEKFIDFHAQVLPRISALPGVKNVAMGWGLPLTGNQWIGPVELEGQSEANALQEKLALPIRCVTPEYFDTLGIKIAAGRGFVPTDAFYGPNGKTNALFVAMINQAMADRFFPNENPVGKKLILYPGRSNPATIVGVVQNARSEALTREAASEIYLSFWQFGFGLFVKHLVISTASDPHSLIGSVQQQLRAIDPTVAIEHVKTFDQIRSESVASQTFAMRLLVAFSLVGSVLALVGIFGVLSLSVGSRRREIAIRMAVGAQRRDVLSLFLGEGLKLIAVGLVLGTGVAIALARLLEAFLFGVGPTDPATFAGVAILFTAVALLACYIPARRAARTDLMAALRYE